ncbi:MAG: pilin [Minisyncoccia bacterium]
MRKKILFLLLLFLILSPAFLPSIASADSNIGPTLINPLCPSNNQNCGNSDLNGLLTSIVNWLITIGTPIAVGMILFGAFQMVFAGGDPEKFKKGKQTILYTAIGYAIILIGWGLTKVIESLLSH